MTDESNKPIIIGIDAEWQGSSDGKSNNILSYQWFGISSDGEWSGIHYTPSPHHRQSRIKLSQWLSLAVMDGLSAKTLSEWPRTMFIVSHYSVAELTALKDFVDLKNKFDNVQKTFVSISENFQCTLYDQSRNAKPVALRLLDTLLLVPGQSKRLDALGDLHNIPKVELGHGSKSNMLGLLQTAPELFERYAIRDAEICARHVLFMWDFAVKDLDLPKLGATLGGMAVSNCLELWKGLGLDPLTILGKTKIVEKVWLTKEGHKRKRRKEVVSPVRHRHETLATESYHGGRNETYFFGPSARGVYTDFDLSGAYSTAMVAIGIPDWDSAYVTGDIKDFIPSALGLAEITFRFPDGTRFPCLPVRTHNGLIFPLSGYTHAGSPEIFLALRMGAKVEILHGVVVPWKPGNERPFERFVAHVNEKRKSHEKGSIEERMWKEIGNSLYGKLAQGLHQKRVFDTRSSEMKTLPPSKITNPYLAAFITSFVRAVLGEILANINPARLVISATTDGLLTDATEAEMTAITSREPLCTLFGSLRQRLVGDSNVVEVKGQIARMVGVKTRFQFTEECLADNDPILARVGMSARGRGMVEMNDDVKELFLGRDGPVLLHENRLKTLRKIYDSDGDLVPVESSKRLSLEYDWKRNRSGPPELLTLGESHHVAFDTGPWEDATQFEQRRESQEHWRKAGGGAIKALEDLQAFEEYCAGAPAVSRGLRRSMRGGAIALAKRQFLRAFVRGEWGLDNIQSSYRDISDWLTSGGYQCTVDDLKNAKRGDARLETNVVPLTSTTEAFVEYVKGRFHSFNVCAFFVSEAASISA